MVLPIFKVNNLIDSSDLKQGRDKEKYEKAVKLEKKIEKIKKAMVKDMKDAKKTESKEHRFKQNNSSMCR